MNINKNKDTDYYHTSSFYIACFLHCKKIRLIDIDKTFPSRAEFVFEYDKKIETLIRDFDFAEKDSPSVVVDARELILAIKSIKDKLYQK